jgi:MacB-like periplasmic core domain
LSATNVWKKLMGGDPHAVGKTLRLSDYPFRVIGMMPPGFEHVASSTSRGGDRLPHGESVDVWLVYNLLSNPRVSRANHYCNTIARLKPGVSIEQAQAEMNVIASRLAALYPEDRDWRIQLQPLQDDLVASARPTLLILAGRGRLRAGHRLRQRGQPAAGPRCGLPRVVSPQPSCWRSTRSKLSVTSSSVERQSINNRSEPFTVSGHGFSRADRLLMPPGFSRCAALPVAKAICPVRMGGQLKPCPDTTG